MNKSRMNMDRSLFETVVYIELEKLNIKNIEECVSNAYPKYINSEIWDIKEFARNYAKNVAVTII